MTAQAAALRHGTHRRPEVVVAPERRLAELAADAVETLLRSRPTAVLGLATGSSPVALYDELARRHVDHGLDASAATAFLLDEYVGLPADHPERYRTVIEAQLTSRIGLPPAAVHSPDGLADDLDEACERYEEQIAAAGGVDLQVLGIGTNGHIAFNEPGSSPTSRTRVVALTEQTRQDNARFFGGDVDLVPRHCLTQGLATIMQARHLVLLATGEHKAEAVRHLVEGPVSPAWPATVLRTHPRATVLVDEAAASLLHAPDDRR